MFDFSPDGKTLYVSNEDAAQMSVVDHTAGKGSIEPSPVGEEPEGVTVRPDGAMIWVTWRAADEVVAVDAATHKVIARFQPGPSPGSHLHERRQDRIRHQRKCRAGRRGGCRDSQSGRHDDDTQDGRRTGPATAHGGRAVPDGQPGLRFVSAVTSSVAVIDVAGPQASRARSKTSAPARGD